MLVSVWVDAILIKRLLDVSASRFLKSHPSENVRREIKLSCRDQKLRNKSPGDLIRMKDDINYSCNEIETSKAE